MELVDADTDPVHAETEIQGLAERQKPDIAKQKVHARGKQRPDEDFRDHADPKRIEQRRHHPRHRKHEQSECCQYVPFDENTVLHRTCPLNRPCGRNSRTTLISTSDEMRAIVGLATLCMMPSSSDRRIAAAAVPGRFPRPPMMTAMKQTGRRSTPPRKSTVVIGAATIPPKPASANPTAKVAV